MKTLNLILTTIALASSIFANSAQADFRVNQNQLTQDWQLELVKVNHWGDKRMKVSSSIAATSNQIGVTFSLPFGK